MAIIGKINDKILIDDCVLREEEIETREGTYFDGYTHGIYKAQNIIDKQQKEIERLNNIIEELKRFNRIRENYLQLIANIGYDYDGMNTVEGLKGLVDELCEYALWGRDLYDFEPIYENNGKVYNILDEEIKGSDKE